MSEFENVFRRKELHDMYSDGEVKSLEDVYLIEDTALTVQELTQKLDFYKGYKKKRVQDIADEMKVIQNKIEFFKLGNYPRRYFYAFSNSRGNASG